MKKFIFVVQVQLWVKSVLSIIQGCSVKVAAKSQFCLMLIMSFMLMIFHWCQHLHHSKKIFFMQTSVYVIAFYTILRKMWVMLLFSVTVIFWHFLLSGILKKSAQHYSITVFSRSRENKFKQQTGVICVVAVLCAITTFSTRPCLT